MVEEAQCILRYAMPGSIAVLLVAAWFLLDAEVCQCHRTSDPLAAAAVLAGVTLPIGFIAAQIASIVGWWSKRWWLTRLDGYGMLAAAGALPTGPIDRYEAAALADEELHSRGGSETNLLTFRRARSLIDLMQALGNGSAASAMGAAAVCTAAIIMALFGDDPVTRPRWLLAGAMVAVSIAVAVLMAVSHWRVRRLAQPFVERFLERTR